MGTRQRAATLPKLKPQAPAERPVKEVPLQVMIPGTIRRQVAFMSAESGENIRTIVLRGLRAVGVDVPDSELLDRRGRRRKEQ